MPFDFNCNFLPSNVLSQAMRFFLVGLVLLCIPSSAAFGQADGFVEKIGFGKTYRPYGWTPLLVNLTSKIGDPADYQIQVRQEDLDRDRVIFRRDIVLNANKQEQFWVYFIAQPRGFGDGRPADLNKLLDVRLCTRSTGKTILKLNIQDQITNLDPPGQGFGAQRGVKLVLMVTDGTSGSRSTPSVREYAGTIGINEEFASVLVTPFDLPENMIGYDAVDAIVWLDADAGNMTAGGSRRMKAMTDWVRNGGRLVVSQPNELFKLEELADLLPVEVKNPAGDWQIQLRDRASLEPIRTISQYRTRTFDAQQLRANQQANWDSVEARGPFKVAYATLRDGAVGEEWIDWNKDGTEMSPWIARRPLGLGSVTWVAQDLGNPTITGPRASGWPHVWDRVLGQRNTDLRVPAEWDVRSVKFAETARAAYQTSSAVDLGAELLEGMEHKGRAGGLIFLAGVFFVGYWVVAGPVSYLVLLGKKKTELSWGIFAASALIATLVTVGVVRLVLRGDPEIHHVSLVRMLPAGKLDDGTPISRALINSRIGLYIPRDGMQTVKLLDNDPQGLSYITPFSIHPAHQANTTDFPAYLEYEIPVRDNPLTDPVQIGIPYRSTLKKLQAQWSGRLDGGIDIVTGGSFGNYNANKPKLMPMTSSATEGTINGLLENRVGVDLAHVYIAFNYPPQFEGQSTFDYVLYIPSWPNGQRIDLRERYNGAALVAKVNNADPNRFALPGPSNVRSIRGEIGLDWSGFWYAGLKPSSMTDRAGDFNNEYIRAFPMLSLFERVPPQANVVNVTSRVEILRRAARDWDISEQVAAGQLVILAQAGKPGATAGVSPLPFKLEVDDDIVEGTGVAFYQFALPLDRSNLNPWPSNPDDEPATKPTTAPTVER